MFMRNLILLHGALGVSGDMEPLADKLRQQGVRVVCHTFSGHGNSPLSGEFGIPAFCNELEALIGQCGPEPVDVFGYSMGGYVALCLALKQPQLFHRIITLGTKFDWNDNSVEKETRQLDAELILQKVPAFAAQLQQKHGTNWKHLLDRTAGMMRAIGRDNLLNDEALTTIGVPVWLGLADRDQMVSLEETRHVFKQLPKAGLYMLPGGKHPLDSVDLDLLTSLIQRARVS